MRKPQTKTNGLTFSTPRGNLSAKNKLVFFLGRDDLDKPTNLEKRGRASMTHSEEYEKGMARFKELFGTEPRLGMLNEDFMQITMEHLFGNIWTRPGLELRERSLITMAALTVLGREPELKTHMCGALNIGISKEKITEMMIHLAYYGGWPVAVKGLRIAQEVFEMVEKKKD